MSKVETIIILDITFIFVLSQLIRCWTGKFINSSLSSPPLHECALFGKGNELELPLESLNEYLPQLVLFAVQLAEEVRRRLREWRMRAGGGVLLQYCVRFLKIQNDVQYQQNTLHEILLSTLARPVKY